MNVIITLGHEKVLTTLIILCKLEDSYFKFLIRYHTLTCLKTGKPPKVRKI